MFTRDVWPIFAWPIFAWPAGIFATITLALALVAVWSGDDRFGQTAIVTGTSSSILAIGACFSWSCLATYTAKPRGWRKIRREKEREAYIRHLEQELGLYE